MVKINSFRINSAGIVGITARKKDEPPKKKTLNALSGFADMQITQLQNTVTALEFDYAKGEDATVSISKAVEGLKEYKTFNYGNR